MNRIPKSWACTLLALALLLGLALAGTAVDTNRDCVLRVLPASGELLEDLEGAQVVLDLYQLASAVEVPGQDSYTYAFRAPYDGLSVSAGMDAGDWNALAQQAAVIALDRGTPLVADHPWGSGERERISASDAGGGIKPGLYLLIARERGLERYAERGALGDIVTIARSASTVYSFAPTLISLPSKPAGEDGQVTTDTPGEWVYDLTVTLKPADRVRFGALKIVKTLEQYRGSEPAVFVFDVEAVLDGEVVFSDTPALVFSGPGTQSLVLDRIPVGAEVTVREVYSGACYTLTSRQEQTAVIQAAETARVEFVNDYDGRVVHGHGVINEFEHPEGADHWNDFRNPSEPYLELEQEGGGR